MCTMRGSRAVRPTPRLWPLAPLLLAALSLEAADPADSAHPAIRRFASADGLPNDTINAIRMDPRGYLWVGTQNGAARFDGRRFTVVDMPDPTVNYVRDVLPLEDGTVWFARQSGGVVRLADGAMTTFENVDGEPLGRINALYAFSREGATLLYAARHSGAIARWDGARWSKVPCPDESTRAWKLLATSALDGTTRLLAATEQGLLVLDGERFTKASLPPGTPSAPLNNLIETSGKDGPSLWIGAYGAGVLRVRGGRLERFDAAAGLGSNLVTSLVATDGPDGPTVWVATRGGLARIDGDRIRPVPLDARSQEIYSLAAPQGYEEVWVGTRGNGLLRLTRGPWSTLDFTSGLPAESVFSIINFPGPDGPTVYLGSNRGLGFFEGGRWRTLDPSNGLPGFEVPAIARSDDARGPSIWIATLGNGLAHLRGGKLTRFDAAHGLPSDRVNSLLTDGDGVWVGSDTGSVYRLDSLTEKLVRTVPGLPRTEVLRMVKGLDGTLFCATRMGLAAVTTDGALRLFRRAEGLPNDEILTVSIVETDARSEVWAGTRGGVGVLPLPLTPQTRATPLGALAQGLAGVATTAIVAGSDGSVWLGTQRGIARLRRRAGGTFETKVFTTADGLPSNVCHWGVLRDPRGRIWISTTAGVAIFDPEREITTAPPPKPLVFERLLVDGSERRPAPGMRLTHRETKLTLELALLSYAGEGVQYRTQLEGLEAAPGAWTSEGILNLNHVPPGRYVFRAWGRDHNGVESGPIEWTFHVLPPPWRTGPAYALYVLLAGAVVALGVRSHSASLRRRNLELAAVVEERTRDLKAARDQALAGSQTKSAFLANVSHELRTPLNAILGYAEMLAEDLAEEAPRAVADLERIRLAARHQIALINELLDLSKIEAGRFELHVTRFPVRDLIDEVLDTARPLVERARNELSVEVDGVETMAGDRTRLGQVLLNLLGNAAKFTKDGRVTISTKRDERDVLFVVSDSGVGMTKEQMSRLFQPFMQADASTASIYGGTGLGLVIAKRFSELMGGDLTVMSEPGQGSTFTVRVPGAI